MLPVVEVNAKAQGVAPDVTPPGPVGQSTPAHDAAPALQAPALSSAPVPPPRRALYAWIVASLVLHGAVLAALIDRDPPVMEAGEEAIPVEIVLETLEVSPQMQAAAPQEPEAPNPETPEPEAAKPEDPIPQVAADPVPEPTPAPALDAPTQAAEAPPDPAPTPEPAPTQQAAVEPTPEPDAAPLPVPRPNFRPPPAPPAPAAQPAVRPRPAPRTSEPARPAEPARPVRPAAAPPPAPARPAQRAEPTPAAGIANWQRAVMGRLSAAMRYPDSARVRGATGAAAVTFSVDDGGRLTRASLARSTGQADLDAEASAIVRRAAPFPPPPPGAPRSLTVPINFNLR